MHDMVEYTDIDGQKATKTVFFNLTQYEVEAEIEIEEIQARFQKFMDEVIGPDPEKPAREMTPPEKREMFRMIKQLVRHSYGIKNGKRFIKSQEIWDEFEQTGAFSAYMYQLFLQQGAANRFMEGIWPQGVDRVTPEGSALTVVPDIPEKLPQMEYDAPDEKGSPEKAFYEYTNLELLSMSDETFDALVNRSKEGNNVPQQLLFISGRRKAAGGQTE